VLTGWDVKNYRIMTNYDGVECFPSRTAWLPDFFVWDFTGPPILASRPVSESLEAFFSPCLTVRKSDAILLHEYSNSAPISRKFRNLRMFQQSLVSIPKNQILDDGLAVSERKKSLRRLPKLMAKSENYEELSAGAAPRTGCQHTLPGAPHFTWKFAA
jgi:hypothetical protein